MARVQKPSDDGLSEQGLAMRDKLMETRGLVEGPFKVLLHSPGVGGRIVDVGTYVRFLSPLPDDLRCIGTLLVARAFDCEFEWAAWAPKALDAGVPEDLVAAIREGRAPDDLGSDQAAVYEYCRQLTQTHRVSPEVYDDVVARLGLPATVDLTAAMGYFAMLSFLLNAFEIDAPEGSPRLS